MESKNLCASEDVPFGTIQSRSAYSRSNAGWRPSFARSLIATPPSSRRVRSSDSASSAVRRASSTMSDLIRFVLLSPLFMLLWPPLSDQLQSPLPPSRALSSPPAPDHRALGTSIGDLYVSCAFLAAFIQGRTVLRWSASQLRTPSSGLPEPASLTSASSWLTCSSSSERALRNA